MYSKNNLWTYGPCIDSKSYLVEFDCPSINICFRKAFKNAECSCGNRDCFVAAAESTCKATYLERGYTKSFDKAVDKYVTRQCSNV